MVLVILQAEMTFHPVVVIDDRSPRAGFRQWCVALCSLSEDFTSMVKKTLLKVPVAGCVFLLLFVVAACGSNSEASIPGVAAGMQGMRTQTTATTTVSQAGFAATVGSSGGAVNPDAQGDNLTTIHSPVDRPVAKFTQIVLHVSPKEKGVVYIQNDSGVAQTLVSDTAGGFAAFTIAPYTTTSLVFHRAGTFMAHLKGYPMSTETVIVIVVRDISYSSG
ncbi:MAG: hypothetical protein J2P37_25635 [Ktedonobacteraceae bacterium]|nr:hypothetical protein [Ktedonobacteraceae bacterium]MBO0795643.1 hypothetical protein [Ktedonobacteraceae bacterium]